METIFSGIPALFSAGAILAFVLGGLLLIFQAKKYALMALVAGVGLAVGAAFLPRAGGDLSVFSLLSVFAILSAIGGVIALTSGRPRTGLLLFWPAFSRWILWPLATPYLPAVPFWLVLLVLAPFWAFILIWILQKVLTPIYGDRAASHVTGEYLVRAVDGSGRALGWLLTAPFRLIGSLFSRRS